MIGKAPKWPNVIRIIRHGQSERNVKKDAAKAAGTQANWSEGVRDQDTGLTIPRGREQSLSVGFALRQMHPPVSELYQPGDDPEAMDMGQYGGRGFGDPENLALDTIFVSPYLRTRQTNEQIVAGLGYQPKIVIEERIREIEFGILDGLSPEGMRVKYPEEVRRRAKEGKYYYRPPGGENRPDVNLRVHSFIDTLVRDYVGKNVAVVCHSVVVLCFRHLFERWDESEYLQVDREEDVKNASITTYTGPYKIRLESFNKIYYPETE